MSDRAPALDDALSEREAADRLGLSPTTLGRLRQSGDAPPHVELPSPGDRPIVKYPPDALEAWVARRYRAAGQGGRQ
jgi:hypothetical protein